MVNRILLLGSKGSIGNFLFNNLSYEIIPISRKECELADFNSVKKLLKQCKPDIVINCAANLNRDLYNFNFAAFNENINIFLNFFNQKEYFKKFINLGSGAEFDRRYDITNKSEEEIRVARPVDHYGLSKNLISNLCLQTENFFTLRIFGCLGSTNNILFDKIINNENLVIEDKYFDYIYINDLIPIINYFINHNPKIKDINIVYKNKYTLEQIIKKFIETHNLDRRFQISAHSNNYTGCSKRIESFDFNFLGLEEGMKNYSI